jgi:two-component system, cell cycle response regulator
LRPASAFLDDLSWIRMECSVRSRPVSVCYLDVDDFKAFNSALGEVAVDRDLLPGFMRLLEAHAFGRGAAYKEGGDEYFVILPNATCDSAVAWLKEFIKAVGQIESGSPALPTLSVSVGIYVADADSFHTNREICELANKAKNFAKKKGKARVASFASTLARSEDLVIVWPTDMADPDHPPPAQ